MNVKMAGIVAMQVTSIAKDEDDSAVSQRVIEIIAEWLGVAEFEATPDKRIVEDLGADSLDRIEILMELESEFDIEIDDRYAERIVTVQNAIDIVNKHIIKASAPR